MNRALKSPDSYKPSILVYLKKEKERQGDLCVYQFPKLYFLQEKGSMLFFVVVLYHHFYPLFSRAFMFIVEN